MKDTVNKMMHTVKFFKTMLVVNLVNNMQYKINFLMSLLINLFSSAVLILFYLFVFDLFQDIQGWDKMNALLLSGTYITISSFYIGFAFHSLSMLPSYIVTGELDGYLIRPVNTRLYLSTRQIDYGSILSGIIGLGFTFFIAIKYQINLPTLAVIQYLLFNFFAFLFLSDVIFILMCLGFWFGDVGSARDWFAQIIEFGNRPSFIYPKILKIIFYFFFPILLLGNIPLNFLISKSSNFSYLVIVSILCFHLISRLIWKAGLKRYSSAEIDYLYSKARFINYIFYC